MKGGWVFLREKIEEGETQQEALAREIKEELETKITVGEYDCFVTAGQLCNKSDFGKLGQSRA